MQHLSKTARAETEKKGAILGEAWARKWANSFACRVGINRLGNAMKCRRAGGKDMPITSAKGAWSGGCGFPQPRVREGDQRRQAEQQRREAGPGWEKKFAVGKDKPAGAVSHASAGVRFEQVLAG